MFKLTRTTTRTGEVDRSESFHLVMRFIYLLGLPIYIVQGVMVAYIKYSVGYLPVDMGGYPVPYTLWPAEYRRLIYVIYYLKALAWSGEGIVHLEELTFWLYLIHLKDNSPIWFRSPFFKFFVFLAIMSSSALVLVVWFFTPNVLLVIVDGIVMTSMVAFAAQAVITLLIFLPRNLRKECKLEAEPDSSYKPPSGQCGNLVHVEPSKTLRAQYTRSSPQSLGIAAPAKPTSHLPKEYKSFGEWELSTPTDPRFSNNSSGLHSPRSSNEINWRRVDRTNRDVPIIQGDSPPSSKRSKHLNIPTEEEPFDGLITPTFAPPYRRTSSRGRIPTLEVTATFENTSQEYYSSSPPLGANFNSIRRIGNHACLPRSSRVTHFPRYFAFSDRQALENDDSESLDPVPLSSWTTLPSQKAEEIAETTCEKAPEAEPLLHPAIR
ncbi:hypothetical protein O181_021978 [Austropuccinia psidii MF-1]|uniref:Uncharacterized protein n=1 Tax=Austropuccinia psidii MF-1 TaxID=1389203 RepID=A0A9Q3CFX3_9BASI|nr:hypothetical protein [Austropuccinia psidii MF-1]